MSLNLKDFQRFEKQIILKKVGIAGQKKIHQAKVLIIGMGGIGCPLLTYLASAGICNIGIVDHDKVEIGNLNRQIIFNAADLINQNPMYMGVNGVREYNAYTGLDSDALPWENSYGLGTIGFHPEEDQTRAYTSTFTGKSYNLPPLDDELMTGNAENPAGMKEPFSRISIGILELSLIHI